MHLNEEVGVFFFIGNLEEILCSYKSMNIILKYIMIFLPFIFVGSRFVADRNSVGFARKTALTISFVERGFERLGLDR